MSAPKLRFKEFDGDWPELKLKDLVKSLDAGVSVNSEDIEPQSNEYSVLKTSCISSGYFDVSERKRVLQVTEITRLKEPVLENSILMSRMNTPLLVGMNAYVSKAPERTFLPDRLWQLKINEEKTFTRWLAFYLGSDQGLNQIRDLASGTSNSMKNITKSDVMNLGLFVPSKEEQTKIASFLSAVDEKISQLTQKHQLLSQYKQGMMQKLFSQQIRFKADDGSEFSEWSFSKLNNYINESKDKSKYQDEYDVLTSSRKGLIKQTEYFEDSRLADRDNIGFNIIKQNEITYRSRSDDGLFFFNLNKLGITGIISTYYPVINMKNSDNRFFHAYLNFHKHEYVKYAVGTSQLVLSLNELRNMKFYIPCLAEQTKIANFLSSIDQKIEVTAQQIEQAKQWKKGLLQQMFV